jgi:hypothetical protein
VLLTLSWEMHVESCRGTCEDEFFFFLLIVYASQRGHTKTTYVRLRALRRHTRFSEYLLLATQRSFLFVG